MTHKEIISNLENRYSYTDFLKACASSSVDALDADGWANVLSGLIFQENVRMVAGEYTTPVDAHVAKPCCGGGKVR